MRCVAERFAALSGGWLECRQRQAAHEAGGAERNGRAVAGDALPLLGAVAERVEGGGSRSGSIHSSLDTAAKQWRRASVEQSRDGCCEVDSTLRALLLRLRIASARRLGRDGTGCTHEGTRRQRIDKAASERMAQGPRWLLR